MLLFSAPVQGVAQAITTDWMTSGEYQAYFASQLAGNTLLLTHVEAGEFHGQIYYFATFDPLPPGIGWATHHGLSDASFAQRDQEFTAQGYRLTHHQRFVSSSGRVANQGIWLR
jgi:hypothetical protein